MSYSLGVQTHAAIIARVHRSVPTNLMPNAKRMRAFVYPIQPSLFIRVIGFIASSSQKTGLTARFVDVLPLTKRSGDDGKGIRVRWVARETARIPVMGGPGGLLGFHPSPAAWGQLSRRAPPVGD